MNENYFTKTALWDLMSELDYVRPIPEICGDQWYTKTTLHENVLLSYYYCTRAIDNSDYIRTREEKEQLREKVTDCVDLLIRGISYVGGYTRERNEAYDSLAKISAIQYIVDDFPELADKLLNSQQYIDMRKTIDSWGSEVPVDTLAEYQELHGGRMNCPDHHVWWQVIIASRVKTIRGQNLQDMQIAKYYENADNSNSDEEEEEEEESISDWSMDDEEDTEEQDEHPEKENQEGKDALSLNTD